MKNISPDVFLLFIYLFIYFLSNSNQLYKQLLEDDNDKFEAELGNSTLLFYFLALNKILFFLALKQVLISLCKSCLQGSQSVETVIRIFTELQVNCLFMRRLCFFKFFLFT